MGRVKTATPSMARAINDRLALDLLLERGPLTAPQLRELTGLSRPTVSDLIERLKVNGLIEEAGECGDERRGPNARLYGLVAGRAHVAGVDVRRDAVHATVADITGRVVGSAVRALPGPELSAVIAETVATAGDGRALHTVVLGAPGLIDPHTGGVRCADGDNGVPGWRSDLLDAVRLRLGAKVLLENEVNLAAIAELRVGAAVGHDDFVLLWLDDGVGAAVVLDGRLRRGRSGGAGEVGLLDVDGQDFCCTVEIRVARTLTEEELAERITRGAFPMVTILDPGLLVLGGTTGRDGGDSLAALVAGHVARRTPAPTLVRATTVAGNAILQGAVLTALDLARDEVYG